MNHLWIHFRADAIFGLLVFTTLFLIVPIAMRADEPETLRWAIAIHGGAGGVASEWSEQKRQNRRDGLTAALTIGQRILADGGTSLDAVEAVIVSLENDPSFNAGRGAVLNKDGEAQLDASIMNGRDRSCGAIAGVRAVKNPISTARRVMTQTPHVLLVGVGADEFAQSQNVPLVDPEYFISHAGVEEFHLGTVGCVALDRHGDLAAGTSTGGTSNKLPGRVGDSPIVGAGTYADNATCAVSGTGLGEEYIRHAVAYDIAAQMRYAGASLDAAVTDVMTQRLGANTGGVIAVGHDGSIVIQHNTPAMSCGAADSNGRFDISLTLEHGGRGGEALDSTDDFDSTDAVEAALTAMIDQQAADWNRGDIDAFMSVYWNDEGLTFSSAGEVTRGWRATLERYKTRYPDKATMGQVTFSELEFLPLDAAAVQVLGVWDLQRDADPTGGRFTLIFRKQNGRWRIVHDHTSVRTETK